MSAGTVPCDDCGRRVKVPDSWPCDWAYCAECRAAIERERAEYESRDR